MQQLWMLRKLENGNIWWFVLEKTTKKLDLMLLHFLMLLNEQKCTLIKWSTYIVVIKITVEIDQIDFLLKLSYKQFLYSRMSVSMSGSP